MPIPSRPATVALLLATPLILSVLPTGSSTPCELVVRGTLATSSGTLPGVTYALYDLIHDPATELMLPAQTPSQNRDTPAKRWLHAGASAADGTFEACLSAADESPLTGSPDLVLMVRAESAYATIHTPGLVTRTVENLSPYYLMPFPGESPWTYTAYSSERRNVGAGLYDFGSFAPAEPATGVDRVEWPDNEGGPQDICFDHYCTNRGPPVPVTNPTAGAFDILAQIAQGRQRVLDLEEIVHAEAPGAPPHVDVYYPQNGCGGGCYDGRSIALSTLAASTVLHEYGHHIHRHFGSNQSPGGAHTCSSIGPPQLAWGEGVADFMAAFLAGSVGASCGDPEGDPARAGGMGNEQNVQNALWDLQDDTPAEDALSSSPEKFWRAFTSHPRNYGDYQGFHDRWIALYPEDALAAHSVACQNRLALPGC